MSGAGFPLEEKRNVSEIADAAREVLYALSRLVGTDAEARQRRAEATADNPGPEPKAEGSKP